MTLPITSLLRVMCVMSPFALRADICSLAGDGADQELVFQEAQDLLDRGPGNTEFLFQLGKAGNDGSFPILATCYARTKRGVELFPDGAIFVPLHALYRRGLHFALLSPLRLYPAPLCCTRVEPGSRPLVPAKTGPVGARNAVRVP